MHINYISSLRGMKTMKMILELMEQNSKSELHIKTKDYWRWKQKGPILFGNE